ncbi:MAG: hypothetical protein ACI8S6_002078 [Myxococcota bacterium]
MYRVLLLGMMMLGCGSQAIRRAAVETEASALGVLGIHPAGDAAALRGDVAVHVVFGDGAPDKAPGIRVTSAAREWMPPCSFDETGRWMTCAPMTEMPRGQVFDIELLTRQGDAVMVSVASELPEGPRAYRLTQVRVGRFGASRAAAEQLSTLLAGSDLIAVTEGGSLESGKHTLRMGLAEQQGEEFGVQPPGLTMVYDFVLQERLAGRPQDVFLPLQIDTEVVPLFIEGCTIKAELDDWRMSDFTIAGTISALSLVKLIEPLGTLGDVALSRVELDVDTDGDGDPDAVSFKLTAEAPRVALRSN